MPGPTPDVQAFRTTIDDTIRELNGEHVGFWFPSNKVAGLGKLLFASIDATFDRPVPLFRLPHEGHAWAVIHEAQPIGRYVGAVAIVSTDNAETTLQRRVGIRSPLGQGHIESARTLDQVEEMAAALRWAQSPHTHGSVIRNLAALTPFEEESIGEIYNREREAGRSLRDELQRMDMNRRILGEGSY